MNKNVDYIIENKIIAIVRNVDFSDILPLATALYNGGIRVIEITFDTDEKTTVKCIKLLVKNFGDKMLIGAGTVIKPSLVELSKKAGAKFIVTPSIDEKVIKKAKELKLATVIGAFTPTEIFKAKSLNADIIKLFPTNALSNEFIKSVLEPIKDVNLFAFGGVNIKNAKSFIKSGAKGVGIGANLIRKDLIEKGKWSKITKNAEKFVKLLK